MNIIDYSGRIILLTDERLAHIKEHPEMVLNTVKINETLAGPDIVVRSKTDEEARLYYKHYTGLYIGDKYLCIVVKYRQTEAFVVTAYFTDNIKKGDILWKK